MLRAPVQTVSRNFITTAGKISAVKVFQNSCYHKIDFKINENSNTREAVTRFTAFNIGCLAVTDDQNKVVGVCSERDYINKVAALGKKSTETKVKEICTYSPHLIVARETDSLQLCMNKMLLKDIRHLIIMDDKNEECLGLISIKDLINEIMKDNQESITRLSDFNMGRGAFFGSD
jgi:hypothetical protein